MAAKSKLELFRNEPLVTWTGSATSSPPTPTLTNSANGTQELIQSSGHDLSRLGDDDVGGAFHCVRRHLSERSSGIMHNRTVAAPAGESNGFASNYLGSYYAAFDDITDASFPVVNPFNGTQLQSMGTTAIARVLPTNPLVGLTTTLGEIRREGIPSVVGAQSLRERALRARNAGKEYLNVEFGWRPLVSEVLALADAILDSDRIMRSYEANSGKWIHRRYEFPTTKTSSVTTSTGEYPKPAYQVGFWNSTGTLTTHTTEETRVWFSGCFTYYLAPQGSLARKEQLAAKRFGLRITPEALWNLTPWTWAVDWVTNLGDVIHNVSAFANDGLAMPYGYIMRETTLSKRYVLQGARTRRFNTLLDLEQTLTTVRKRRLRATPYGFGLSYSSFTGRQWAILVALGLAKAPGQPTQSVS